MISWAEYEALKFQSLPQRCLSDQTLIANILKSKWSSYMTSKHVESWTLFKNCHNLQTRIYRENWLLTQILEPRWGIHLKIWKFSWKTDDLLTIEEACYTITVNEIVKWLHDPGHISTKFKTTNLDESWLRVRILNPRKPKHCYLISCDKFKLGA